MMGERDGARCGDSGAVVPSVGEGIRAEGGSLVRCRPVEGPCKDFGDDWNTSATYTIPTATAATPGGQSLRPSEPKASSGLDTR